MTDPAGLQILLVDDDADVRDTIARFLTARHHEVSQADSGERALSRLEKQAFDIVITDLKMPGMDGFQLLERIKEDVPGTEVIVITAFGEVRSAVTAIKTGAFDFFTKPVQTEDLEAAISRTSRYRDLRRENERYQEQLANAATEARERYGIDAIVGKSQAIESLKETIRQVSTTRDTTVLVSGETGTGKELVAHAIHVESDRRTGPFVAVDCSAIPRDLVEAEFYGHQKGAYTGASNDRKGHFERASGGTLFLDEIGDMDPGMQAKLLRTLESRRIRRVGGTHEIPVDVRIVSATNADLNHLVSEGGFRSDLFYRLNTFTIAIPPLRERTEDIRPIAEFYLDRYAHRLRKAIVGFDDAALTRLADYAFPGNIRELRNLIERAVILCKTDMICVSELQFDGRAANQLYHQSVAESDPQVAPRADLSKDRQLDLTQLERAAILEALDRTDGNREQASKLLGITRYALRRRLKTHGLDNI